MRLTVIGCGDAFGSGGCANTCFWIEAEGLTFALDFGATSLVELKRRGLDPRRLDAIVLSHLHGDHYGGLPFLMLDAQFDCDRRRPLTVVGPVGTAERLRAAQEAFFPGTAGMDWHFPFTVVDLPCDTLHQHGPLAIETHEVFHPSGAPATGVRIRAGGRLLAFSGDSSWVDNLRRVAKGADLYIAECFKPAGAPVYHMDFETLQRERASLGARRIMLTHMSPAMLDRTDEARAAGYLVAHDGLVVD
ncbi:MAG: MBL fold metallo-hydrolase, partial [Methylobacteriaceae bacterium]|nr:MBL fold metallo-hydrolase [Methylobacteriaceae bacterium]